MPQDISLLQLFQNLLYFQRFDGNILNSICDGRIISPKKKPRVGDAQAPNPLFSCMLNHQSLLHHQSCNRNNQSITFVDGKPPAINPRALAASTALVAKSGNLSVVVPFGSVNQFCEVYPAPPWNTGPNVLSTSLQVLVEML